MSETRSRAARRAATSQRIIEAAQREFGEHGYEATTVRAIAKRAGIDPSLVIQHYGSKDQLFRVATELPAGVYAIAERFPADAPRADVIDHLLDVLTTRMDTLTPETRALTRSMLTSPAAAAEMKTYLEERIANLARATGGPGAELQATVAVSSLLGITIARHFLGLDALAEAGETELTELARTALSAILNGA